ncbi:flagellar basal body rod protein FlgB [Pseudomonas chlororaphis subsp. aurantiaca]|uniref:flagellar basal body rod protein FlgB n=1 Tax=Pseudomonas chlororaphis TaxID=587753 RepID=UPI0027DAB9A5|nr:flagellar basal body rod protein FlgB [Pseudomonas chlororaphis]WMI97598.1 flagellar basal body rod protein FlgB [Pseudomonas chlororaphis subsp. aurantiaca]
MSIRLDDAMGVHMRALGLHMQRSEILAANLANEDTPGFQARDLDFAAEMRKQDSPPLFGQSSHAQLRYRVPAQPSQDGNTVELSVEQAAFAKSAADFQTSLTFLNIKFRGLKQAIEGR